MRKSEQQTYVDNNFNQDFCQRLIRQMWYFVSSAENTVRRPDAAP